VTPVRPAGRSFPEAVACALRGLIHAARSQRHFRAQLAIAAGMLLFAAWAGLRAVDLATLLIAVAVVLGTELLNTAVEMLTDLLHPDHGPAAAAVKDVAASAALVAAVLATAVGVLLLMPRVIPFTHTGGRGIPALLAVLCVVLLAAGTLHRRRAPRP
jgi:diacylglycerol kinase (ATP)